MMKMILLSKVDLVVNQFKIGLDETFQIFLADYVQEEIDHITECLSGQKLFNLSSRPVDGVLEEWVNKGSKFNPYIIKSKAAYLT